jgi:Protein of unknown function DUF262
MNIQPEDDEEESAEGPSAKLALTDKDLERLYDETSSRILQERNDFFLPQIRDFIEKKRWVNLRPDYQRRHRWDQKKQSRLIESLLMNVPVPPIFLFENELSRYEVMDGQQRLTSIIEFYSNTLELQGLEVWTNLQGKKYRDLPLKLRRGLDRRRISAVTLLAESLPTSQELFPDIRRQVFERLNTGGTALNHQELRNCIYSGPFNDLIISLARAKLFCKMWEIPFSRIDASKHTAIPIGLRENKLFQTMGDCQIVLRFFAFRENKFVKGSVKSMLDECMKRNRSASDLDIKEMKNRFESRIKVAHEIFGIDAFKLPLSRGGKHSRPLFDALMIGIDRNWANRAGLVRRRNALKVKLATMLRNERTYELVIGRPNTAKAVLRRIQLIEKMFRNVAN